MATPNKIAPQFPLQIDEDSGAYNEYGLEDLTKVINQNLKMVLLTSPGERLMYPNFGVGLRRYLFEHDVVVTRGLGSTPPLRENIISQIETYLPYIRIEQLEVNNSSNNNMLNVKLRYSVINSNTSAVFNLTVTEVNDSTL